MSLPNLLIVGSQKCGTTWLHECLSKSQQVYGSKPKELNFFNAADHLKKLPAYRTVFEGAESVRWRLESTPHYFRLPEGGTDIAARIRDLLGEDACLLVMFRDPVERYLSSYTHHMMQGRFPYVPVITEMTDAYRILGLGDYASILLHWRNVFPDLGVFFYDDLLADPKALIQRIMAHLETPNDIPESETIFLTNAKSVKIQQTSATEGWQSMPVLAPELRRRLASYYLAEIKELENLTGRDLTHWCQSNA